MKRNMKRKIIISAFAVFVLVTAITLGCIKLYRVRQARQSGILLAFDDYSADNWESRFDLFDKYDVKVTFFLNASEPTDFCYRAIERGHEIGFHSIGHIDACAATDEEIQTQIIDPIDTFRRGGYRADHLCLSLRQVR